MIGARGWGAASLAIAVSFASVPIHAQQYPLKLVRIIVPWPPGGGSDLVARLLASKLGAKLGQQFVVENHAGASGIIGTEVALKAPADGYTIMVTSGSYPGVASLYKLRFDPIGDMLPIIKINDGAFVVSAHPSLPVKTIAELVALAKSKPGQIVYASSGVGSMSHLSTELMAMVTGITLTHVPYKGTGQSIADTIAGQIQLSVVAMPAALPHVKSGRLRALAVTSRERVQAMRDVPTVSEAGYDYVVSSWHAVMGPTRLAPAIVERLNGELNKIIRDSDFVERIASDGLVPAGGTPELLTALVRKEISTWTKVVARAGIKME
jgi:tripartite-type tricarboxylate transporter receptor subunit TctC